MFIHSVVIVVLSILSGTAAYAATMPVAKERGEHQAREAEQDSGDTLDQ